MLTKLKDLTRRAEHATTIKIGCLLVFTASADFLLYDQQPGWNLAITAWLLLAAVVAFNGRLLRSKEGKFLILATGLVSLSLVESPGFLAISLTLLGIIALALPRGTQWPDSATTWLWHFITFPLRLTEGTASDANRLYRVARARRSPNPLRTRLTGWALPLVLGAVFASLLVQANPVIDAWLPALDWARMVPLLHPLRHIFWLASAVLVWACLRPRSSRRPAVLGTLPPDFSTGIESLFNLVAVQRALILFNVMFLAQTGTDIVYLWSGERLPYALTYAGYAHRGAYPLIATALLAGAFTLIAFREGAETGQSKIIRWLVYLWICQNVFLTVNAIWRTVNYIEAYGLTHLRVAALIWMGLVAAGLIFIICKIALTKSGRWLADVNAVSLLLVLCLCSFVNFGGMIANFNVKNSAEFDGPGQPVDLNYLEEIGPAALPALMSYLDQAPRDRAKHRLARHLVGSLSKRLQETTADWRGWSFRRQRLLESLDQPGP